LRRVRKMAGMRLFVVCFSLFIVSTLLPAKHSHYLKYYPNQKVLRLTAKSFNPFH